MRNEPKVNYLGASAADKDRKLRKLADELAALKLRMQGGGGMHGYSSSNGYDDGGASSGARVLEVLQQLGIKGTEVLPDGSFRLADGRIVGLLADPPPGEADGRSVVCNHHHSSDQFAPSAGHRVYLLCRTSDCRLGWKESSYRRLVERTSDGSVSYTDRYPVKRSCSHNITVYW